MCKYIMFKNAMNVCILSMYIPSLKKQNDCFPIMNALWIARELPFIIIEAKDKVKIGYCFASVSMAYLCSNTYPFFCTMMVIVMVTVTDNPTNMLFIHDFVCIYFQYLFIVCHNESSFNVIITTNVSLLLLLFHYCSF